MKAIFALLAAGLMVLPAAATPQQNSTDYEKGYADGYAAALVALSGDLSEDQYAEILAYLQEIKEKLDKKESSNAGARSRKVVSLVGPEIGPEA
jgi:uncharacterized protein YpuA (DUF1002 family)